MVTYALTWNSKHCQSWHLYLTESHAAVAHLVHDIAVLASPDLVGLKVAVGVKALLLLALLAIALNSAAKGQPAQTCPPCTTLSVTINRESASEIWLVK